jgi:adenylate kinase family enzyme
MEFQRVAVIGVPGAGKSTVSRELTRVEGMERYE